MSKIQIAIVGYGNIGKYSIEAVQAAPDMELRGIVRRQESLTKNKEELAAFKVVSDIEELGKTDVALICSPSRNIQEISLNIMAKGIATVNSFDIHGEELLKLRRLLHESAIKNNTAAILSAGWDPGTDSVIRTIFKAMAPKGITHTNFGPGMSMGHSVAAKSKEGVRNALSITTPAGSGRHRRIVYIEAEENADIEKVSNDIKTDPYFINDETQVIVTDSVDEFRDMGHGVLIEHKGISGHTQNQLFEFRMKINNPALTAQIMVSCARAVLKQKPGAYTLPEIPPIDLLPGDKEKLLKNLV